MAVVDTVGVTSLSVLVLVSGEAVVVVASVAVESVKVIMYY